MSIQLLILSLYVLPFAITLIYCLIQSYRYKTGREFLNNDNADFLASLFLMSLVPIFNWVCAMYVIMSILEILFNNVCKFMFGEGVDNEKF